MSETRILKILITGGARGIGRGLFRHFLTAGHKVFILDSNLEELAHTTSLGMQAAKWKSGRFQTKKCDLRDRSSIKQAVEDAAKFFEGKLDVLVNNAFATPHIWSDDKTMEDPSDKIMEEWDTKVAVGLTAPFLLSRLCLPLLKEGGTVSSPGCIINISSTRAYQAEMNHEAYSAVKAGLLGLTQSMAISLGHQHKIRVNAIIPGWIDVQNENKAADQNGTQWGFGMGKEDHEWHPAGRVGKVDDMAKAVEYLIDAEFVTGQEIVVDGGVGRKMVYPE